MGDQHTLGSSGAPTRVDDISGISSADIPDLDRLITPQKRRV